MAERQPIERDVPRRGAANCNQRRERRHDEIEIVVIVTTLFLNISDIGVEVELCSGGIVEEFAWGIELGEDVLDVEDVET